MSSESNPDARVDVYSLQEGGKDDDSAENCDLGASLEKLMMRIGS